MYIHCNFLETTKFTSTHITGYSKSIKTAALLLSNLSKLRQGTIFQHPPTHSHTLILQSNCRLLNRIALWIIISPRVQNTITERETATHSKINIPLLGHWHSVFPSSSSPSLETHVQTCSHPLGQQSENQRQLA